MEDKALQIREERIETFAEIHEGLRKAISRMLAISCDETKSLHDRAMALRAAAEAIAIFDKMDDYF